MDSYAPDFAQTDFDSLFPPERPQQAPVEIFLRLIDSLTADRSPECRAGTRPCSPQFDAAFPSESSATSSMPLSVPKPGNGVPQQLLGNVVRYNFGSAKPIYFENCSDPPVKSSLLPSKYQKGVACGFAPDFRCKQGAFPVISTCSVIPASGLCGRCGSLGDDTMIYCQGCCDPFHAYCAHVPARLVPRLTSWYCHRHALCTTCGGSEKNREQFPDDIIETCFRCSRQFHIYCGHSNNFVLFYRNSATEFKVCRACYSQSQCKRCGILLSGVDLCRDFVEEYAEVCIGCRNNEERELCRSCHAVSARGNSCESLRKFCCHFCKDIYHGKCAHPTGRFLGDSFACPACVEKRDLFRHKSWSSESAAEIVDELSKFVIALMNCESGDAESVKTCAAPLNSPSANAVPPGWCARGSILLQVQNLEGSQSAAGIPAMTAPSDDAGIDMNEDDVMLDVENTDPLERVPVLGIYAARQHSNRILDDYCQPSPDSGVPASGGSSPAQPPSPKDSYECFSTLVETGNLLRLTLSVGNVAVLDEPNPARDVPVLVVSSRTNLTIPLITTRPYSASDGALPLTNISCRLKKILGDLTASGDPSIFLSKVQDILLDPLITDDVVRPLRHLFEAILCHVPFLVQRESTQSAARRVMPVLGNPYRPVVRLRPTTSPLLLTDTRVCLFCAIAGDDLEGIAGRLLSLDYDLWAHIGCISFCSFPRRCYDFTVLKMENTENEKYWRSECATCSVRMGIVGCLSKSCSRSYHINCAASSGCSVKSREGILCPVHKSPGSKSGHQNPLPPEFSRMPVFGRVAPTNVRSFSTNNWTTGMPRETVKVYFGSGRVERLGQLVRGWELPTALLACGYSMDKVFWSSFDAARLTTYRFIIVDMNAHPELHARICEIVNRLYIPDFDCVEKTLGKDENDENTCPSGVTIVPEPNVPPNKDLEMKRAAEAFLSAMGCGSETGGTRPVTPIHPDVPIPDALPVPSDDTDVDSTPSPRSPPARSSITPEIPLRGRSAFWTHDVPKVSPEQLTREKINLRFGSNGATRRSTRVEDCRDKSTADGAESSLDLRWLSMSSRRYSTRSTALPPVESTELDQDPCLSLGKKKIPAHRNLSPAVMPSRTPTRASRSVYQGSPEIPPDSHRTIPRDSVERPVTRERTSSRSDTADSSRKSPGFAIKSVQQPQTREPTKRVRQATPGPNKRKYCADDGLVQRTASPSKARRIMKTKLADHDGAPQLKKDSVRAQTPLPAKPEILRRSAVPWRLDCEKNISHRVRQTPKFRSMLKSDKTVQSARPKVRFDRHPRLIPFDPEFHALPGFIADPRHRERDDGPYFPPCDDPDWEPENNFKEVKLRAREEVSALRERRIVGLVAYLSHINVGALSRSPSRICLLTSEDGFFAAARIPQDLVSHLYQQVQNARISAGYQSSGGIFSPLQPLDFLGLTHPAVLYLLEQLPVPSGSPPIYSRRYFPKEVLKNRIKGDVDLSRNNFLMLGPICATCPLPPQAFAHMHGCTILKSPVIPRQVLFRWSASYCSKEEMKSAGFLCLTGSVCVCLGQFPDFYKLIRQASKDKGNTVLVYALEPTSMTAQLALIAARHLRVGDEVRLDPHRKPRTVQDVFSLNDFSCVKHDRKD